MGVEGEFEGEEEEDEGAGEEEGGREAVGGDGVHELGWVVVADVMEKVEGVVMLGGRVVGDCFGD